jgi:hypothetical protein
LAREKARESFMTPEEEDTETVEHRSSVEHRLSEEAASDAHN